MADKSKQVCGDGKMDVIRGIQRGLDDMKAGKGESARKVLGHIRAKHKIPNRKDGGRW